MNIEEQLALYHNLGAEQKSFLNNDKELWEERDELWEERDYAFFLFLAEENVLAEQEKEQYVQAFEESYIGIFEDPQDFVQDLMDNSGQDYETWPYYCIDYEKAEQELIIGGDVYTLRFLPQQKEIITLKDMAEETYYFWAH